MFMLVPIPGITALSEALETVHAELTPKDMQHSNMPWL